MGVEFAERVRAKLTLLPGIGHFPHLQNPMLMSQSKANPSRGKIPC
jgi:hypothetical protein